LKSAVEAIELIPSAKRLIRSLRDVGYDFSAAVADIVDNSIEWGATSIDINVEYRGRNSWVRVADNGKGMSEDQLVEAMRFGSERAYSEDALGKFGLGLKTASLSQCSFVAVASRNDAKNKIEGFCWDLDHIAHVDKWEILKLTDKKMQTIVFEPLIKNKSTGTVVFWWKLDRFLEYKHSHSVAASTRILNMDRELEEHLAMVFHRFLSGYVQGREKVKISLNGNPIEPWDPFVRKEKTVPLEPRRLTIEYEGATGNILAEPYILPSQQEFSSMDAFNKAGGPTGWNQQQGFYIYRANRLIQSGGWCKLRTQDEHTKLARIALSFSPTLDDAFKLNVSKMQVQLPSSEREYFDSMVKEVVKIARERYDRKERKSFRSSDASSRSSKKDMPISESRVSSVVNTAQQTWTLDELEKEVLAMAKAYQKPMLRKIFERIREKFGMTNE
jgi:hypothetical protein